MPDLKRCPYPLCIQFEHEEGPHKFGRPQLPAGELRLVQEFSSRGTRCDTHATACGFWACVAEGFYIDMLGCGWALCAACAKRFSVPAAIYAPKEPAKPKTKSIPPAPLAAKAVVIPFQARRRV